MPRLETRVEMVPFDPITGTDEHELVSVRCPDCNQVGTVRYDGATYHAPFDPVSRIVTGPDRRIAEATALADLAERCQHARAITLGQIPALPDPDAMREAARPVGIVEATSERAHAATMAITRRPHRDRFWVEGLLDALHGAGLRFRELRCRHGSLLTEYCMTGCSSNTLRTLMAQAFEYEIPGLYKPGAVSDRVGEET